MTKEECLESLRKCTNVLRTDFGVKSLRLFGSVARGEQSDNSDVDLCVEMAPKMLLVVKLKSFLESTLGRQVDLIRMHSNMNNFLLKEIERDGIRIF